MKYYRKGDTQSPFYCCKVEFVRVNAKCKTQSRSGRLPRLHNIGTALGLYMIGHSEECNDEESLLVLLYTSKEILRFAQNDKPNWLSRQILISKSQHYT